MRIAGLVGGIDVANSSILTGKTPRLIPTTRTCSGQADTWTRLEHRRVNMRQKWLIKPALSDDW
jgi:hypothetical protein